MLMNAGFAWIQRTTETPKKYKEKEKEICIGLMFVPFFLTLI